jgi:hypothetical protein
MVNEAANNLILSVTSGNTIPSINTLQDIVNSTTTTYAFATYSSLLLAKTLASYSNIIDYSAKRVIDATLVSEENASISAQINAFTLSVSNAETAQVSTLASVNIATQNLSTVQASLNIAIIQGKSLTDIQSTQVAVQQASAKLANAVTSNNLALSTVNTARNTLRSIPDISGALVPMTDAVKSLISTNAVLSLQLSTQTTAIAGVGINSLVTVFNQAKDVYSTTSGKLQLISSITGASHSTLLGTDASGTFFQENMSTTQGNTEAFALASLEDTRAANAYKSANSTMILALGPAYAAINDIKNNNDVAIAQLALAETAYAAMDLPALTAAAAAAQAAATDSLGKVNLIRGTNSALLAAETEAKAIAANTYLVNLTSTITGITNAQATAAANATSAINYAAAAAAATVISVAQTAATAAELAATNAQANATIANTDAARTSAATARTQANAAAASVVRLQQEAIAAAESRAISDALIAKAAAEAAELAITVPAATTAYNNAVAAGNSAAEQALLANTQAATNAANEAAASVATAAAAVTRVQATVLVTAQAQAIAYAASADEAATAVQNATTQAQALTAYNTAVGASASAAAQATIAKTQAARTAATEAAASVERAAGFFAPFQVAAQTDSIS